VTSGVLTFCYGMWWQVPCYTYQYTQTHQACQQLFVVSRPLWQQVEYNASFSEPITAESSVVRELNSVHSLSRMWCRWYTSWSANTARHCCQGRPGTRWGTEDHPRTSF